MTIGDIHHLPAGDIRGLHLASRHPCPVCGMPTSGLFCCDRCALTWKARCDGGTRKAPENISRNL